MAKLLETWLNSEVELSKKVTDLETDFSNGYLLGELLYKYNQQPDFHEFSDAQTRMHVLGNFTRMIETFKSLGVKFDTRVINAIINKESGAASKLLYQVKMALEKTSPPLDMKLMKDGRVLEQRPVKSIRPARAQYDKMEKRYTEDRLHARTVPQKQLDLDAKLQKFKEFRAQMEQKAENQKQEEMTLQKQEKEEKRKVLINKLQRNAGFMEDWEQKGVLDWKKNMEAKKKREQMELTYKLKSMQKMQMKADSFYSKARNEAMAGIEDFEKSMKEFGIPVKPYKEDSRTTQSFPSISKTSIAPHVIQERDIRRRTMAANLYSIENSQEAEYRTALNLSKLDVLSPLEESVAQDIWKVTHYTELFIAHRKLRESRYERRQEYDLDLASVKEQKLLERWIDNSWLEIELEHDRAVKHENFLQIDKQERKAEAMKGVLDLIIGIAEQLGEYQQVSDSTEIDPRYQLEWFRLFKDGVDVSSPDQETLNQQELTNYVNALGQWKGEAVHNFYLTEALEKAISWCQVEEKDEPKSQVPNFPVKLSMIGYPFSGKTTHATRLANRYNLSVVEVKDLIEKAVTEDLYQGGCISDSDLVSLIVEEIKKSEKGWILVDFPTTVEQAKLLEEALTNFKHKYERPLGFYEEKKQKLHAVCPPETEEQLAVELEVSGLDHVIWIDTSKKECLRRSIGKRVSPESGIIYHVEDDQPPFSQSPLVEQLEPIDDMKEHRGVIVDRSVALDRNSKSLRSWFAQFAKEDTPLLKSIEGNRTIIEIGEELSKVVQGLIQKHQDEEDHQKKLEELEEQYREDSRKALEQKRMAYLETLRMLDEDEKENQVEEEEVEVEDQSKAEVVEGLWDFWEAVQGLYETTLKSVFQEERETRTGFSKEIQKQELDFIEFLKRPSNKQEILTEFQFAFNKFSDENPDMREDPHTIAELHQRTEDLGNKLWDIIELRQQEAEEQLREVMQSGWLEAQQEAALLQAQKALTVEHLRYSAACQVLADYYFSQEKGFLPKPQVAQVEFTIEGTSILDSLEKMCAKAETLPGFSVVFEEESKDPKGKKRDNRKKEEEKQKSPAQVTLENALSKEQEVFKSRVNLLKNWTKNRIEEMESKAKLAWENSENWIYAAINAENEAVQKVCDIAKEAIENQTKLQPLLELQVFDAIQDHSKLTFQVPAPSPLPPSESRNPFRIPVSQLHSIVKELAQYPHLVSKQTLTNILARRTCFSRVTTSLGSLPSYWLQLGESKIVSLLSSFDYSGNSYLDWRDLANSLVLLEALPVSQEEVDLLVQQAPFTKETWMEAPAWFDQVVQNQDQEGAVPYNRTSEVKELLWTINSFEEQLNSEEVRFRLQRTQSLKEFLETLQ